MFAAGMRLTLLLIACPLLFVACDQQQDSGTRTETVPEASGEPVLEFRQLRPDVWIHTSYNTFEGVRYPSNGLVVREDDHLVLLDPAWGVQATRELLARIDREIGLPVERAFATHFHGDRTDGVDVLAEAGIEVMAHPLTLELSAEDGGPVPTIALNGLDKPGASLVVGDLEVFYPGPGHAVDNIMIWIPAEKTLYGGCAIREMATDSLGNTTDADMASWPVAVKRAKARYAAARVVIPGHGSVGGPELLDHMLQLFETSN